MMKGEEKKVPKGSEGWIKKKKEGKDAEDERNIYIYVLEESEKDVTYTHLYSFSEIINRFPFFFLSLSAL